MYSMKLKINHLALFLFAFSLTAFSQSKQHGQQWKVFETSFVSKKDYSNSFMDVQVDVLFGKDGKEWKIPAFWDGDNIWKVRFAPPEKGSYSYRVISSDKSNNSLDGKNQSLTVMEYTGDNRLYEHGMIGISGNKRHFAHADGTPFFWLGDTWWKNLCKRMTWEGFQELAADRKEKGFSVIQIVCGPYPDEGKDLSISDGVVDFGYGAERTLISGQGYVNPNDLPITIDKDFLGNSRNRRNPTAGPFEITGRGIQKIKIW